MTFLLIALVAVSVLQPAGSRRAACCLFAGVALGFDLCGAQLPGELYFIAAAATDAICVALLDSMDAPPVLSRLCLVSICLNFAGWFAYEQGLSGAPYEMCFTVYYVAAILCIALGGLTDATSSHFSSLRLYFGAGRGSNL